MRPRLTVLAVLSACGSALAQHNTSHFNFILVDDAGGTGSLSPSSLSITGGDAGLSGETEWQGVTPLDGTLSFEWEYASPDTGCFDTGYMDVNGSRTTFACNSTHTSFGIVVFNLAKGDRLDLGVWTANGTLGPGVFKITGFDFEPVPAPGPLIVLALAAWPRRARAVTQSKPASLRPRASSLDDERRQKENTADVVSLHS